MNIEVQLFATLRDQLPPDADGRRAFLDVPGGTTVAEVLNQLGIRRASAKLLIVDGVHTEATTVLQDGNVLSVFPPIAGG